jgi:glycosyltransferase involved in cell wall biosynthesis
MPNRQDYSPTSNSALPRIDPVHAEFAACTIIAKNYLAFARVLARSFQGQNPGCPFFVLLVDPIEGRFDAAVEPFHLLEARQLSIPHLKSFLFKYDVLEVSTAVKPYFLATLFDEHSIRKLIYLDPDILVLRSLTALSRMLDSCSILLTPHTTTAYGDARKPSDLDILRAGAFNLGFLGLRATGVTRNFLEWWQRKVYHHGLLAFEKGMFVDQKWIDLVPSLFTETEILRDPTFNVAYWNLHERRLLLEDDQLKVNGSPCHFFHFSGFNPLEPKEISKHQTRFKMNDLGKASKIFENYRMLLLEAGHKECCRWPYTYAYFTNGTKVPASARRYFWGLGDLDGKLGDPFTWLDEATSGKGLPIDRSYRPALPFGINVVGYLASEKGTGESVRSNVRILAATNIPYNVTNFVDTSSANREDLPPDVTENNSYAVNLLNINADQIPAFARKRPQYLHGHYNIGYWTWELDAFPSEWRDSFSYVDEIWVPSTFVHKAILQCSPLPVEIVPHSINPALQSDQESDRTIFGFPADAFIFLFLFDFHSFMARKNPDGLIRTFKRAFGKRKDVMLVIKTTHGDSQPSALASLQQLAGDSNIRVFDAVFSSSAVRSLIQVSDCYVSLHRSEGFGLTLAEAMYCGKPTIATGYSGNLDFMNHENSFLVNSSITTIRENYGPYKAGGKWAEPDLEHALEIMRLVERERSTATQIGARARESVAKQLHPGTIAKNVRQRLERIRAGRFEGESTRIHPVTAGLPARPVGVNIAGFLRSEKGVGEAGRSNVRVIKASGLPFVTNDFVDSGSENVESSPEKESSDNPYRVNLINVNGDLFSYFMDKKPGYLHGHYNVAFWNWELSQLPAEWCTSFRHLDEIWVPSTFVQDSVRSRSPLPVRVIPLTIEPDAAPDDTCTREKLRLPSSDVFIFLFLFDFHSFFARKNPDGLIQSFKRAFGSRKDVMLLIKSAHASYEPRLFRKLQEEAAGANVQIFDSTLSRPSLQSLVLNCDAYVSLHRSEGFGLTLSEAMACGKPVIATGYSGNLDFMNKDNSLLVGYNLSEIREDHGPYKKGSVWAEPDLDHAAELMQLLVTSRNIAVEIGQRARQYVRTELHPSHVASLVRKRLAEVLGPKFNEQIAMFEKA